MKYPLPWEKGLVNDVRRYMFKRMLRRRIRRLVRTDRDTALEIGLGLFGLALTVSAGAYVIGRIVTDNHASRQENARMATSGLGL